MKECCWFLSYSSCMTHDSFQAKYGVLFFICRKLCPLSSVSSFKYTFVTIETTSQIQPHFYFTFPILQKHIPPRFISPLCTYLNLCRSSDNDILLAEMSCFPYFHYFHIINRLQTMVLNISNLFCSGLF